MLKTVLSALVATAINAVGFEHSWLRILVMFVRWIISMGFAKCSESREHWFEI